MSTIANKLAIDIFYSLGKDYVRYYPKRNNKCERLQSFAVLESFADLNTPNLGKTLHDTNKPFFWSRAWAAKQYSPSNIVAEGPLMFFFEEQGIMSELFTASKNTVTQYTLQLAFLQKYEPADRRARAGTCESMTRNEIYYATESFARNFFAYLGQVRYYEGVGFKHKDIADQENPGSTEDERITRQFQKMLRDENPQVQFNRWEGGINNYYGTYLSMAISIEVCQELTYDPAEGSFSLGYDRGCC